MMSQLYEDTIEVDNAQKMVFSEEQAAIAERYATEIDQVVKFVERAFQYNNQPAIDNLRLCTGKLNNDMTWDTWQIAQCQMLLS